MGKLLALSLGVRPDDRVDCVSILRCGLDLNICVYVSLAGMYVSASVGSHSLHSFQLL